MIMNIPTNTSIFTNQLKPQASELTGIFQTFLHTPSIHDECECFIFFKSQEKRRIDTKIMKNNSYGVSYFFPCFVFIALNPGLILPALQKLLKILLLKKGSKTSYICCIRF